MGFFGKLILTAVVVTCVVGCGTLDPLKERKDGNVAQLAIIQHVKSGRLFNDVSTVSGTNAAAATSMVGGGTGTSLVAGLALIVAGKISESSADNDDYYVSVTRPDDLLFHIGPGSAKPRLNPIGKVKLTTKMDGARIGDWVKIVKMDNYWTLIPCKLPESGCQNKIQQSSSDAAQLSVDIKQSVK